MILLSFCKVTNGGRATSHRWGWDQLFWELSCIFSTFFAVEFSIQHLSLKEVSVFFSHKKQRTENQKQFNMWLPATFCLSKFPMFWTNCDKLPCQRHFFS